ncbi:MAG TPA: alpha/beta hydrolase [Candidatus Saccharibacteria bacterium]|nr:alpha/beta hydrolase [Candidatus Saccharibacteria bacterium]
MTHPANKKQILIVHGGESFNSYASYLHALKTQPVDYDRLKPRKRWSSWLAEKLPSTGYDVLTPTFPNGRNANYDEWKIYFEKLVPFLGDNVQLVGHSLGAMFLSIYLHNHVLATPVQRLILISGCYDDETNEELGSFKVGSAQGLEKSAQEIHLLHSKEDPVVPFSELAKFQADIPSAISHVFEDRGHFNDETFPELLNILKQK